MAQAAGTVRNAPSATAAPTATGGQGLRIVPSLSGSETLTNNVQPGTGNSQGDAITQVTAGLHLSEYSGRFRGFVDYALTAIAYAHQSDSNQIQQYLNAQIHSEFIERQGFLDASASISRQSISAFGTQTSDNALLNANSTEVRTLRVTPSYRGQFPGRWSYLATLDYGISRTGAGGVGDSSGGSASLQLDRQQQGRVSLSALAKSSILKYTGTRDTTDDLVSLTANVDVPEANLQVSASAGYERSNVITFTEQSQGTWGAGLHWTPSPRTRLDATYDKRQFGPTHSVSFETRTARTVWSFVSSQQISTIQPSGGTTFHDLYYTLFSTLEPDPAKRSQLVDTYLQLNGISPNGTVPGSFIPRSTTWTNNQTLSGGWVGLRSGFTVSLSSTDSWQANPFTQVGGDLANGQHVHTTGLNANLSHRLTPQSNLNLIGTVTDSRGNDQSPSTRLRTLSLMWSSTPTAHLTVSAEVRRSDFESPISPYYENALIGTVAVSF